MPLRDAPAAATPNPTLPHGAGLARCLPFVSLATLLAAAGAARTARAQRADATWLEVTANSELETYLRAAQVAGEVPLGSLSIRPFGPRELDALVPHDTAAARASVWGARARALGRRAALLPAEARVQYSANYPWAFNDGAVWAGRGATASVSAGMAVRVGVLTAVLRPLAFIAQNRTFALTPSDAGGGTPNRFLNPIAPFIIDLPQRFGDGAYGRVDPGESTVRVDVGPLAAGFSTSAQGWGPAVAHALVMGPNAGGFRHVFYGTSRPQRIGIGRLHVRGVVGLLDDSPEAPPLTRPRVGSGLVAVFTPAGVPGLEIGATRFYHTWKDKGGLRARDLLRPLGNLIRTAAERDRADNPTNPDYAPDNELASGFVNWTLPSAGLRAYAEFLRNDNPITLREAIGEPDHSSAYTLGLQRVRRVGRGARARLVSVRGELVNGRASHLQRVRVQTLQYAHAPIIQGHTERGQLLGSVALLGGSGGQLAADVYERGGRWSLALDRLVRNQRGRIGQEGADPRGWDVANAVTAERVWVRRRLELRASLTGVLELNRDFGRDTRDVYASTGVRWLYR